MRRLRENNYYVRRIELGEGNNCSLPEFVWVLEFWKFKNRISNII